MSSRVTTSFTHRQDSYVQALALKQTGKPLTAGTTPTLSPVPDPACPYRGRGLRRRALLSSHEPGRERALLQHAQGAPLELPHQLLLKDNWGTIHSRSRWCGRGDSNPHGLRPSDFKSLASTGSATPAQRAQCLMTKRLRPASALAPLLARRSKRLENAGIVADTAEPWIPA